ncbi:MAG: ThiF family adenylyltransferase [Candidatus Micrarchaeota archaeon]
MNNRFLCQAKVIGNGQRKLSIVKVAVVGVGGTGCNVVLLLAQLGVKNVKLIDSDVVELCNLARQPLFNEKDIGRPKVKVAVEKLSSYGAKFTSVQQFLDASNVSKLLKDVDVVLDCTDNYEARKNINAFCMKNKTPWIYSGAIRDNVMVSTFVPSRKDFECFAKPLQEVSCCEDGVLATSTSVAAVLQVREFLNLINKKPLLVGKVLYFNLSNFSLSFFPLKKARGSCKK